MTERHTIRVEVQTTELWQMPKTIADLTAWASSAMSKADALGAVGGHMAFGPTGSIAGGMATTDVKIEWDDEEVAVCFYRPETDEEFARRQSEERELSRRREDAAAKRELAEYARLKKKFEGTVLP